MTDPDSCYHCGLPIPPDVSLPVTIEGAARPMCCLGCQAVAQAIVQGGLGSYYTTRGAMPASPAETVPVELTGLAVFDHAAYQKSFVRQLGEHEREASLMLEGITCAACVWLNEQHLGQLAGVTGVQINYATRRARVRWDERQIKLSDILAAVAAIGYRAHPYDPARHEALADKERRQALWRVFVAGFGSMQVMMYAWPSYVAADGDMAPEFAALMRWASLILTLPVVFYSSAPFFRNAWRDLKLRRAGMDVPVAIGVGAAFVASLWATFAGRGEVYFDSVSMFVFLLLGGRFLEMRARQGTVAATEAVARMTPVLANRCVGATVETVAASELRVGDRVIVRRGETVPADGVIRNGHGALNESFLTGESLPVAKGPGDDVLGGATNFGDVLEIDVQRVGESTRLSAILNLMERAALERPRLVVMADRVAGWFVAGLLLLAAATFTGWWMLDPTQALPITVAVLVVTCPCALALATPTALTVATGELARRGVLVSRGHTVETLSRVTDVVFDKTGTLTEGRLEIAEVEVLGIVPEADCRRWAMALESRSEHPIAKAFRATSADVAPGVTDITVTPGGGVAGWVEGRSLRVGSPQFVGAHVGADAPVRVASRDGTWVYLGSDAGWLARFRLTDTLRPGVAEVIRQLKADGLKVHILSGDARDEVARVARIVGVDEAQGDLRPDEKLVAVARLQAAGAIVAMVGDGINDAPVLARADVSMAMGAGSDLAKVHADCVLLTEQLPVLPDALWQGRRAMQVVRQNLLWSVAYNGIAVPVAVLGWLTPWMAGIGMSASSLLVVLNALRLKR